jgi:hypothetical protein
MSFGRRRWHVGLAVALGLLVLLVVAVRVVLDPIATHFTRRALDNLEGYRGTFDSVHVGVLPPSFTIRRLAIHEQRRGEHTDASKDRNPLLYSHSARVELSWHELLHGRLAVRLRIDDPKLTVIKRSAAAEKEAPHPPNLRRQLEHQRPLRIERIAVRGGQIDYRDLTVKNHPDIWVHGLEAAVENVATRPALSHGRPITMSARGVLGKSGRLVLFLTVNPWTPGLTFAGRAELRELRAEELYALVEAKSGLQAPEGTADVFVDFECKNGVITGGVKPVLKNVKISAAEKGIGDRLKAWAAEKGLKLFSDRVPGRNAVATVIPIEGRITDPDAQLMPAVLGIIRNAFVEGVSAGFSNLPPPQAGKKQGVITQTKNALQKGKGPPKAQPEKGNDQGNKKQEQPQPQQQKKESP